MDVREKRQSKLLEIVKAHQIKTQSELVSRLEKAGFECTQASVSRDIRELRLIKVAGVYAAPDAATQAVSARVGSLTEQLMAALVKCDVAGENLVVATTLTGTANGIAACIDRERWPGVVGCLAGDDTIFIAVRDMVAQRWVVRHLKSLQSSS